MSSIIIYAKEKKERKRKTISKPGQIQRGGHAFCSLPCFIIDMNRMMPDMRV